MKKIITRYNKQQYTPYNSKCVFCRKNRNLKGYWKCELTGATRGYPCYMTYCKDGKGTLITRILNWFERKKRGL